MIYTKLSRELLKSLKFRVFDAIDYHGFAGVESPVPLIAENEDEGILVVVDGAYAELYCFDGEGTMELVDQTDDILSLT